MEFGGLLNILLIDELEEQQRRSNERLQRRVLRDVSDPFLLSSETFVNDFRLTKDLVNDLINELGPHLQDSTRVTGISTHLKIFTALYFFANGSYQRCVGAHYQLGLKQSTVSKVLTDVCNVMTEHMLKSWVVFPKEEEERKQIQERFFRKYDFPGVIGAVDGTHVAIIAPPSDDPTYPGQSYYNRKGFYSINAKMICDADLKILYCNARFPGSCHDSAIWNVSSVKHYLEGLYTSGQLQNSWLIGDSGYALRPWLLTPIVDAAENTPQGRYTAAHVRSRNTIERCFGVLKQRFRCLLKHRTLHYSPTKSSKIIYCCAILHNMCLKYNVHPDNNQFNTNEQNEVEADPIVDQDDENNDWLIEGRVIRENLIRQHFS